MANQAEVPKIVSYAATGVPANQAGVSKLVMYVWAVPGVSGPDLSNKQGHVYSQIVRRG